MKMAMAAAATSYFSSASASASGILLYALFFAAAGTHGEATEVATSEVPSILPVCKTVGGGSTFFDVQFCLEALGSDDRSANAGTDYRAYSGIAADLLAANATSTAAKIGALLRERGGGGGGGGKGDGGATTRCLRSCQALYGGVVRRQPGCAAAVRGRRDDGEATRCLEEAAGAAEGCEAGFGKSKVASPVAMENDDAFKLAKLAVALLSMAH
jgi:pectinesterase inhibitor-like protein